MKKLNFFALALLFVGAIACNNAETSSEDATTSEEQTEVVEGKEATDAATTEETITITEDVVDTNSTEVDTTAAATEEGHDHAHGEEDHAH